MVERNEFYDINKKYLKIRIDKTLIILTFLILLICIVLYYINNIYMNIFSIIISIVFSVYINKKLIHFIKDVLLKKISKRGGNNYEN